MKFLLILSVVFLVFGNIYAGDFPIMLNVKSEVKIPDDFRDGVEESITAMGYSLVDEKAQQEALKENAKARKSECYDDECLVDTGKMLAARALISVEVDKKNDKLYKFKGRYIDFETGTTTKSKVMYYESKLDDYKALSKFGKEFSALLLNGKKIEQRENKDKVKLKINDDDNVKDNVKKQVDKLSDKKEVKAKATNGEKNIKKEKEITKKSNNKEEKRYKGNFKLNIALHGGSHNFYTEYEFDNNGYKDFAKDNTGSFKEGVGLGFGLSYMFSDFWGIYLNFNSLNSRGDVSGNATVIDENGNLFVVKLDPSPYNIISSYFVLGAEFDFGDTKGKNLVYYFKTGLSIGADSYIYQGLRPPLKGRLGDDLDGSAISTFGIELEGGVNIFLARRHALDIYFLINYSAHTDGGATYKDDVNNVEVYLLNGNTVNVVLGLRYNFYL